MSLLYHFFVSFPSCFFPVILEAPPSAPRLLPQQLDVASRKLPIIAVTDPKLSTALEKHISDLDGRVRKELAGAGGRFVFCSFRLPSLAQRFPCSAAMLWQFSLLPLFELPGKLFSRSTYDIFFYFVFALGHVSPTINGNATASDQTIESPPTSPPHCSIVLPLKTGSKWVSTTWLLQNSLQNPKNVPRFPRPASPR